MAKTIDLDSRTSPDVCNDLVNLEFSYGLDEQLRRRSHQIFTNHKQKISDLFSEWLQETNCKLLEDITLFIKKSLSKSTLFVQSGCGFLHTANVILGMPPADYLPTIDSIEQSIIKTQPKLRICRIGRGIFRKSHLLETFNLFEGSKELLVILEQVETIDIPLLKSLIDSLFAFLERKSSNRILILCCMSSSSHTLEKILPLRATTIMNRPTTIVKDPGDVVSSISARILTGCDIPFSLSYQVAHLIQEDFTYNDPSVTNLKYLYECSIFQHYMRNKHCPKNLATLLLPREVLTGVLKSEPGLISIIKNLTSISKHIDNINWKNPRSVATFCCDQIQKSRNYHKYLLAQMQYYLDMLMDEMRVGICHLTDIYAELAGHDDLGQSTRFVDEINKLQKYPTNSVLKRLDKSTRDREVTKMNKEFKDVHPILVMYKEKLANNDDSKEVVVELINDLTKHTQELKNPLNMPFSEVLIFSDSESLEKKALPADWLLTPRDFTDTSSPYGVLYDLIKDCPEEISAADLFEDFKLRFEEMENFKRKKIRLSNSAMKIKLKPKKLRNTMAPLCVQDNGEKNTDEGLVKAIFSDLLIDMENQGLIKFDKRRSQRGTIKICHWYD